MCFRGTTHRRLGDFNAAIDDFLFAMSHSSSEESKHTFEDARRQLVLTYNDFAVECIGKQLCSDAVLLLNKAIKEEKHEEGLYVNRAGKSNPWDMLS